MSAPMSALLGCSPEEGARLLALDFLGQAEAARPRLDDPDDDEALHDFRVGLRRLRSALRSYRPALGDSVSGKLARRLRRLAAATGEGRDTEVQIAWLRDERQHLGSSHRAGCAWLVARLEERRRAASAEILDEVVEDFAALAERLRERLSVYRAEVRVGDPAPRATFGEATAGILKDQVEELAVDLEAIAGPDDVAASHEARIAAKRLRYLLEPLVDERPVVRPAVKRLKGLQDLLGELHDAHVLETELAKALEEAAAERARGLFALAVEAAPDPDELRTARRRSREPGILALVRRNRDRRDRLHAALAADWLDGRARGLLDEIAGLGGALAAHGHTDTRTNTD
jgi:CHAD domain-containing protein